VNGPLGHRPGPNGAVELQRRFVPVENGPLNPAAGSGLGDSDDPLEQRFTGSQTARFRRDVEVFEVNAGAAPPGGVVAKEHGEAHGLAAKFGNQGLSNWPAAKSRPKEVAMEVGLRRLGLLKCSLVLGEFTDESENRWDLGRGGVADADQWSMLSHRRRYARSERGESSSGNPSLVRIANLGKMAAPAGQRVFVLIPTHTTRHLAACVAALAHQTRPPDGVVVTCDNDLPEIAALLRSVWPRVQARAGTTTPLWHASRPHQGQAHLNQVRNNGIRTLISHGGAAGRDLIVVLDGDTMLAPDALERHARARDGGADLVIAFRVLLSQAATESLDPERVLRNGVPEGELLTASEIALLERRHRRYQRHLLLWKLGLGKKQKPKIIGGHHAFTVDLSGRINGFDEEYVGYGFDDDDFSRRANALRPRARIAICVRDVKAYHLWHPVRAPQKLEDASGYARFARTDLPQYAAHGLTSPRPQPAAQVETIGAPAAAEHLQNQP
jgi:hypothetical protein